MQALFPSSIPLNSALVRGMLKQEMDNFRYGTGDVQVGADYLDSDAMNAYFNAMYQVLIYLQIAHAITEEFSKSSRSYWCRFDTCVVM
mmetsp:Transcript_71781/g.191567  ORF Transcript_71781/g.191567 Transcript_71781/m.191567 type:complete len:88 (+) Transcript_71781:458-721(+)